MRITNWVLDFRGFLAFFSFSQYQNLLFGSPRTEIGRMSTASGGRTRPPGGVEGMGKPLNEGHFGS